MAHTLIAAAHGDGEVSEAERTWVIGNLAAKGYPADVIAAAVTPESVTRDISDLSTDFTSPRLKLSARVVIADAIRAASADVYNAGEHKAVCLLAEKLGVSPEVLAQIVRSANVLAAMRHRNGTCFDLL